MCLIPRRHLSHVCKFLRSKKVNKIADVAYHPASLVNFVGMGDILLADLQNLSPQNLSATKLIAYKTYRQQNLSKQYIFCFTIYFLVRSE